VWHLRVRVIPDAVSIATHDDLASATELDAVEAMWRAAGGQGLESSAGRRAWRDLASAVGAERAAWLARTFPPTTGPDGQITITRPNQTRTQMRAPKVVGLPPAMELWLARGGAAPQLTAQLTVLAQDIDLDLDDPNSTTQPWWASFPEAVRVGLAAEIDLGPDQPQDIDALYVVGIGGGDPGPLLTAQADSGRLGIVPPGSATSSVDGEAAVSLGDADAWRRLVPVGTTAQAGTAAVSKAVVGAPLVRGVIGGERDHGPVNRALMGALWPALWGHALANVWGYGSQADELGLWATANLVPEGPLPAMRIENQPYGLLPATSLHRWKAATGDPTIEARLVPLVRGLVDTWAAAAERQAAQLQGDPLRNLVRNPTAARYAWRWMVPTPLAHALSFRFDQPVPAAELNGWWTRQTAATPRLEPGTSPVRQLVSVGWGQDVGLRLVEPDDLPAGTTAGKGLTLLAGASVPELLAAGPVEGRPRTAPPWGTSLLTELARHSLLATAAAAARRAAGQPRTLGFERRELASHGIRCAMRRSQLDHVLDLALDRREARASGCRTVRRLLALEFVEGERDHAPDAVGREERSEAVRHARLDLLARDKQQAGAHMRPAVLVPGATERAAAVDRAEASAAGSADHQPREHVACGPA
jgi:hypothetical protein